MEHNCQPRCPHRTPSQSAQQQAYAAAYLPACPTPARPAPHARIEHDRKWRSARTTPGHTTGHRAGRSLCAKIVERRIGGLATQKEKDAKNRFWIANPRRTPLPPPETLEAFHDTHTFHLSTPLTLAEGRRSAQTGWTFQGFDRVTGKVAIRPCRRATQQKPWNTLEYGPPGAPRSTRSVWAAVMSNLYSPI